MAPMVFVAEQEAFGRRAKEISSVKSRIARAKLVAIVACLSFVVVAGMIIASWERFVAWREFHGLFEYLGKNEQGLREYRHRQTGIVMVWIPGGTFVMGMSKAEKDALLEYLQTEPQAVNWAYWREYIAACKQHEVTLDAFLIAKHEVTIEEWSRAKVGGEVRPEDVCGYVVPPEIYSIDGWEQLPVDVSWTSIQGFEALTGLTLPTEAQWEYVCRAGQSGPFSGTGVLDEMGWYSGNSGNVPHPVGRKLSNQFGLFDMHGNMAEWCEDEWDSSFYSKPGAMQRNPLREHTDSEKERVIRGGCYSKSDGISIGCHSSFRMPMAPWVDRGSTFGFRPAYIP